MERKPSKKTPANGSRQLGNAGLTERLREANAALRAVHRQAKAAAQEPRK